MRVGTSSRGLNRLRWLGSAVAFASLLFGTAHATTVVTDQVLSETRTTQTDVPMTFGQVFKDGDVPKSTTLTAALNGQPVILQVDPKATNPDGSLRHAVLTAMVPSLAGGAKLPLMLVAGVGLPPGQPITLSQLLATGYNATASLDIGGTAYSVSARTLLQAAAVADACKPWSKACNVWLSGPLASEWVVSRPVTSADGTKNPNLQIYFAVRAYSNGTPGKIARVRTDIIVENTWAYVPQGQPQYTATLTSGSASYTSPALTQYTATRWHKVLWWNNAQPGVYLQQDTKYIQNSMAVSRYMSLRPSAAFLARVRQSCAPLDRCDQTQDMGATGAQPAIGPLPRWTSVYTTYPDVRAFNWMLANTDALGAYSTHYRDEATGWPLSIQKHQNVTIAAWAHAHKVAQSGGAKAADDRSDLLPNCINNAIVSGCTPGWYGTGNPDKWDNAHQPAAGYVAYMVTGSYYYMSELGFDASYNEVWSSPGYRGFSQGLIDQAHSQVRGKAWTLRNMADAAWLLPDSYPLKAEFNADVENSLADWNTKYTHNPNANPLHIPDDATNANLNGGRGNGLPPWQEAYLVWSVNHAAELGFASAAPFRDWLAKFDVGLMTDWQTNPIQGYCWLEASQYQIQVKDDAGNWLPTFAAVYAANFPSLAGLACNSPAMVTAMGTLEQQPWQAGEMHGYASSATGFPSNLQVGLAAIADTGVAGAAQAWNIFDSRSVKPQGGMAYNDYPNFAIVPRSATASSNPIPPPTNPIPPPTNPIPPPVTTTPPPVATPPGHLAPVDHPPLPPVSTQPPVATGKPAEAEPTPVPVKTSPLPVDAGSRKITSPGRAIYLGLERIFQPAFQTASYFANWLVPPVSQNHQPTTMRAVASPAARVGGNSPAAVSPAKASASVAMPIATLPDHPVSPYGYIRRGTSTGVMERR